MIKPGSGINIPDPQHSFIFIPRFPFSTLRTGNAATFCSFLFNLCTHKITSGTFLILPYSWVGFWKLLRIRNTAIPVGGRLSYCHHYNGVKFDGYTILITVISDYVCFFLGWRRGAAVSSGLQARAGRGEMLRELSSGISLHVSFMKIVTVISPRLILPFSGCFMPKNFLLSFFGFWFSFIVSAGSW